MTNGIWLCQNCAKLIDSDTAAYPDTLLIMWKRRHGEFIKGEMLRSDRAVSEQWGPGVLDISGIFIQWSADGKSCVLDLRVSNVGNCDLLINAVEFTVLESIHQMPMGQAGYSALYDLDISDLDEFSSHAECRVAQILKPGEADRFGIILSAPKSGLAAGFRLATTFKTNYGQVSGPDVEIWVPRPKTVPSFAHLKQHYISQFTKIAIEYPSIDPSQLIKTEVGRKGGFRCLFSVGIHVVWYCGPKATPGEPSTKCEQLKPPDPLCGRQATVQGVTYASTS